MTEAKEYEMTNESINYQMTNLFDAGEGENRTALLEDPENIFETNADIVVCGYNRISGKCINTKQPKSAIYSDPLAFKDEFIELYKNAA